jgi:hypothetical protein
MWTSVSPWWEVLRNKQGTPTGVDAKKAAMLLKAGCCRFAPG